MRRRESAQPVHVEAFWREVGAKATYPHSASFDQLDALKALHVHSLYGKEEKDKEG
jgi:hypothetical protein